MRSFDMTGPASDARGHAGDEADLGALFHRLNNQLGVILAHAELLEAKGADEATRARATDVVGAAIEAMGLTRTIRDQLNP